MSRRQLIATALCACFIATFAPVPVVRAVDIEAFEFNDAAGTPLANAANTGSADIGTWIEDPDMGPSDIRGGTYNIVKSSSNLDSNYFQINNITSGTYYLVTRLAHWQFGDNYDPANAEEFRMGFLNDDDADFGTTITAQFGIRRTGATTAELFGDALGVGSSNISGPAPMPISQTQPFTAVIELNKTSNTYKVFYKDGTNPTQVLGMGAVAPTRDGNSVRMVANNDWSEFNLDYPIEPPYEVMAIDRIAVADTNPFTDLITLEIDRDNAAMTLRNTSGATLTGIQSYSITSQSGALNPAGWSPGAATPTTSTNLELAATYGAPVNLNNGQSISLSTGDGAWLKSPFEDFQMVLNLTGGVTRTVNVNFIDNGGLKFPEGDFTFDNQVTGADWLSFIADAETDIAGLSRALRYRAGDLDGDGQNTIADFVAFKTLYDAANGGAGAFERTIAGLNIPEPSSAVLLGLVGLAWSLRRRRSNAQDSAASSVHHAMIVQATGDSAMPQIVKTLACAMVALWAVAVVPSTRAAILEDFPFSDSNGTTLDIAANAVNASNTWILGGNSWDPSIVTAGNYNLTKSTTNLSTAHIDIANVSTGKVWLVAEIAGWNFNSTPSAPGEEIRLAFLDNDNSPPSGSTITAQMDIGRSASLGLALRGRGALGTGATDIVGAYNLPLVQSNPFTMVLELDKDADLYSVYYKDGDGAFNSIGAPAQLGASTLNPGDRDGNSIRFGATGSFSDPGEFFNINRIYLTNTSPIIGPVDPTQLTLEVKSSGQVAIRNDTNSAISFNSYRIGFENPATDDLNFAGWTSLSDQNLDPVGGGNDPGETWDEAGGSSNKVLAESFLLGSSAIAPDNSILLGSAFQPGGDYEDLTFQYYDVTLGSIVTGTVDFIQVAGLDGDYNDDGVVDAADYVTWRKNQGTSNPLPNDPHGGTIGANQYNTWRAGFGSSAGSGSGPDAAGVPEPSSWLVAVALFVAAIGQQRWLAARRAPAYCPIRQKPR